VRITYITHTRFPTEKAHGNQVAQVCHALARLRHEVTLLAPTVRNVITEDPYEYYGLPPWFKIVYPGTFDALGSPLVPGSLGFIVSMWSYRRVLRTYLREHPADLLYVRSPSLLPPLLASGTPVLLELHTLPRLFRRHFVTLCNRCFRIICLTTPMRDTLLKWGVDPLRVAVEADAVDLARFKSLPPPAEAKVRWGLPADLPVIGYAGSLVAKNTLEKGVRELLDALAILKKRNVRVTGFILGGPPSWRKIYEEHSCSIDLSAEDVIFHDRIPSPEVSRALAACDVCVYPAPRSLDPFFLRDTSPLKLFEYLASGRPVVCADLPPIRDVVDDGIVRFCRAGDPVAIADGIQWVLEHPAEAAELARTGREVAEHHTWIERMRRIVGE
jgi:glycosyltransferase involved in cell wall biosynthesis